jgi:hypothetical protein
VPVACISIFVGMLSSKWVNSSKWDKMKYDSDSDHEDGAKIHTSSKGD